jgi:hypothetical protein
MSTRTFEQDFSVAARRSDAGPSGLGRNAAALFSAMGPRGRRYTLTGLGAVLALGLGVATASAVRLPSDMANAAQSSDQTLAQDELPSEAAVRAYALENPPTYVVAQPRITDAAPPADALEAAAMSPGTPAVSYTTNSDNEDKPDTAAPADTENAPT